MERRGEGSVLSLRGRGPDDVEIVLMRMHPHKAGEEFQARRRLFLGPLKNSSIRGESRDNFRIRVGESVLGIRLELQNEGCLRGNGAILS